FFFVFQAEDCIRAFHVMEFRRVLFRSLAHLDVAFHSLPILHGGKDVASPGNAFTAGRAESARLLCKELFEVPHEANRTRAIIKDHNGTSTKTTPGRSHSAVIHFHVEVYEKVGGRTAWKRTTELMPVEHAACVLLDQLAQRHTHGEFPCARFPHLPADAVNLCACISCKA